MKSKIAKKREKKFLKRLNRRSIYIKKSREIKTPPHDILKPTLDKIKFKVDLTPIIQVTISNFKEAYEKNPEKFSSLLD